MDDLLAQHESLLLAAAKRLKGHQRRLFLAEVTLELCDGNVRQAERRFGWGRDTVTKQGFFRQGLFYLMQTGG
jgi:hypothetical protein